MYAAIYRDGDLLNPRILYMSLNQLANVSVQDAPVNIQVAKAPKEATCVSSPASNLCKLPRSPSHGSVSGKSRAV